jgi:hypothetical protein
MQFKALGVAVRLRGLLWRRVILIVRFELCAKIRTKADFLVWNFARSPGWFTEKLVKTLI